MCNWKYAFIILVFVLYEQKYFLIMCYIFTIAISQGDQS